MKLLDIKKSESGNTYGKWKYCTWKKVTVWKHMYGESESAGTIARESGMIVQCRDIAAQICCFIALQIYRKAIGGK